MVMELSDADFAEKTKEGVFIVDFWATWCGPCKMMAPVFEKISSDYKGKLTFVKVNVEDNQQTPGKYGVSGIPCLVIINKGNEIDRIVGAFPEEELKKRIDAILDKM